MASPVPSVGDIDIAFVERSVFIIRKVAPRLLAASGSVILSGDEAAFAKIVESVRAAA